MSTIRYARMESGGPWHSPLVRAICQLGYREMKNGKFRFEDLRGRLETTLRRQLGTKNAPSLETIRRWQKDQPDYPEFAVRNGLIDRAHLPSWARNRLVATGDQAYMRQPLSNPHRKESLSSCFKRTEQVEMISPRVRRSQEKQGSHEGLGTGLILLGALYLLAKAIERGKPRSRPALR